MYSRMDSRALLYFSLRFWPGFHKLWFRGDLHSLLVSLLFGWLLAIAWLATFVWTEWLVSLLSPDWFARWTLTSLWLGIFGSSLYAAIQPGLSLSKAGTSTTSERLKNLEQAQELYLQADYFEAERFIRKNMSGEFEDVESALLWISILRRTRRIPQALELILGIGKLDAALVWHSELRLEKQQCLRIQLEPPPAHD